MPVRVRAPLGHRPEERARPGAARPTSGETFGPGFGIQEVYPVMQEELSTSRGAGFVELQQYLEEEVLDYEDGDEAEEGEIVQHRSVQKGVKLGALQETTPNATRSNHQVGGDRQTFTAGNLPRDFNGVTMLVDDDDWVSQIQILLILLELTVLVFSGMGSGVLRVGRRLGGQLDLALLFWIFFR
ncbi:hypothetical protein NDU88_003498 [Pleurodeles waltl]|uniref:Uncharacterized protein n=1 Tax=Pleurodeles waltl TaxID=8319 RepID=A0AAV7M777_PLEWA|nr:hypothetical protein NDU88_003498 [Pleurodeles waltl]